MRHRTLRSAGVPLRALIMALLAGFGLWQAWTCSDGVMASPMTASTMAHHAPVGHATGPAPAAPETPPDPGMPAELAGLCISVLASFAAALLLMVSPLKLLGLLRSFGESLLRPVQVLAAPPALAQLCVSRT